MSYLVANPEDRFSRDEAHLSHEKSRTYEVTGNWGETTPAYIFVRYCLRKGSNCELEKGF